MNFVCLVFELGDKTLTLSPMENLMVKCNLMLHAKFQNHMPSGSGEEDFLKKDFAIYSHGGHLGHVTLTIYTNFRSPFLRMLHMKFGFAWPSVLEEMFDKSVDNNYDDDTDDNDDDDDGRRSIGIL